MFESGHEMKQVLERLEKLEIRLDFLYRSLGVSTREAPIPEASPELIELVRNGRKVEAIRAFREQTGASLKDAKNFIESMES